MSIALFGLMLGCSGGGKPSILFVNETEDHRYDRALRSSIHTFQERTHIQLGIVLKDRLPARNTIETYAAELFKHTALGRGFGGKGILLLWSEHERLFKVEVAYDLEPIFPDAICHRLEEGARTFMLARSGFARRDFLTELIVTMGFHYLDSERTGRIAELMLPDSSSAYRLSEYLSGGAGVVGRGYAATVEQAQGELTRLPPDLIVAMQPNASAEEVVRRYLSALELGIGAADLPLLTEGSRYFRMEKPHAPGYLRRIRAYYSKAQPYHILYHAGLAAAVFQIGHPVLPILLQKNPDGLWLVDEAAAWSYFHLFESGDNPVPKYQMSPFSFAWQESAYRDVVTPLFANRSTPPALLPFPFDLRRELQRAEEDIARRPKHADAYRKMAELLHFKMYWLEASAPLYEKVLELEPEHDDIRWRLIDIYLNITDVDGQERQYLALLKRNPRDPLLRHLYYNWFVPMYSVSSGSLAPQPMMASTSAGRQQPQQVLAAGGSD